MRREDLEPDASGVEHIADSILALDPLVVVLTGGDPLFSRHLAKIVEMLSGKVGVAVDTSAFTFNEKHRDLFKQHNVAVRISVDTDRPRVNQAQRGLYPDYPALARSGVSTAEAAFAAICTCLDAGLSVTVQTVATKKTANDLPSLGDKLFRLGVRSWRVFKVAPSRSRMDGYRRLVGELTDDGRKSKDRQAEGPYAYVFKRLRELAEGVWGRSMAVQVTYNETPNSVVLVSPDGIFYTESNVAPGKVRLDDQSPYSPSAATVKSRVNMLAHAERYLNLTAP